MYLMVGYGSVMSFIGLVVFAGYQRLLSPVCGAIFCLGELEDATMIEKLWRQKTTINVYLGMSGDR
jgi:hypothetical protein